MRTKSIENMLNVKWYDGLLINEDHMIHADRRIDYLVSELSRVAVDQPGIIHIDAAIAGISQLVDIESFAKSDDGSVTVNFLITCPVRCIAPDGTILIVVPNGRNTTSLPLAAITGTLKSGLYDHASYLVCVRQVIRDDLNITRSISPDQTIELSYPGIAISLLTEKCYLERINGEYSNLVPLARLLHSGDSVEIDAAYIPPVVKLEYCGWFHTDMLASLQRKVDQLFHTSARLLAAGGHILSQPDFGVELRSRYMYYHVLQGILLAQSGVLQDISSLSPTRFNSVLVSPLLRWTEQFHQGLNVNKQHDAAVIGSCARLAGYSRMNLMAGTDQYVSAVIEFLHDVESIIHDIA